MWSIARNYKEDTITFMMESVVVYETRYYDDAAPLFEEMFMEMGHALGREVCIHENHHSEEELKEILPIGAGTPGWTVDFVDEIIGPNGRRV